MRLNTLITAFLAATMAEAAATSPRQVQIDTGAVAAGIQNVNNAAAAISGLYNDLSNSLVPIIGQTGIGQLKSDADGALGSLITSLQQIAANLQVQVETFQSADGDASDRFGG